MFLAITSGYAHFNNPSEDKKIHAYQIVGGLIDIATIATVATLAALVLGRIDSLPGIGTITNHSALIMLGCAGGDTLILIAISIYRLRHNTTATKKPENAQENPPPINSQEKPSLINSQENPPPINSQEKPSLINSQEKPPPINSQEKPPPINSHENPPVDQKDDSIVSNDEISSFKIVASGPLYWNEDVMLLPNRIADNFLTTDEFGNVVREEILQSGYDAPTPESSVEDRRCYLAAHAIFPFLSEDGKTSLLSKMHRALFPRVANGPTLNYLRSYSGAAITLDQSDNEILLITTDNIKLKISPSGECSIGTNNGRESPDSIITLIWNHMTVILTELDPASSQEFPNRVFRDVNSWFKSIEASLNPQKGSAGDLLMEENEFSMKQCLSFQESRKGSEMFCQSGMFCNPVVASQDSEFCYQVTVDVNEDESKRAPAKFKFSKQSLRGQLGVGMERETSFQVFPDCISVEIAKKDEREDGMSGMKKTSLARYHVSLTDENKWKISAYQCEEEKQTWSELYACVLQDDGTWQPIGEMGRIIELKTNLSATSAQNDLHYVLRCLITLRSIYASPYTLVRREFDKPEGEGGCHLNGTETSVAMLQMLAKIDQGSVQAAYTKINTGIYASTGFDFNTVQYLKYPKYKALVGKNNHKKQIENG